MTPALSCSVGLPGVRPSSATLNALHSRERIGCQAIVGQFALSHRSPFSLAIHPSDFHLSLTASRDLRKHSRLAPSFWSVPSCTQWPLGPFRLDQYRQRFACCCAMPPSKLTTFK